MAVFLPSLKRRGYLDRIHITVCIVGSRKLGSQDDYASQGWDIFAPRLTIYGFDADRQACEQANADLATRSINWVEKHIPLALSSTAGEATLHITNEPGCSSLYPPSESYIQRFIGNSELICPIATEIIQTTTLDEFCHREGLEEIDLIQLDVQGGELDVLQGAASCLEKVLAIVTEVELTELYQGQPLFGDVDTFLRQHNFTLFDLCHLSRDIRRAPLRSKEHPGSVIWADAFYFRDLIRDEIDLSLKTPDQLLKLACLADAMQFPDYAIELLTYLTLQFGRTDPSYDFAGVILDCLHQIPELVKEGLETQPLIAELMHFCTQQALQPIPGTAAQAEIVIRNRAYQAFILEHYADAIALYATLIDQYSPLASDYWNLGLAYLIQAQEMEAQAVWFAGMEALDAEAIAPYTAGLIEELQAASLRQHAKGNDQLTWVIQQYILEFDPDFFSQPSYQPEKQYSYLGEEEVIHRYLDQLQPEHRYCVDIAASDGVTMSNTYFLYRQGWAGLAVEGESDRFAQLAKEYTRFPQVNLSKCFVTPDTVLALLEANGVPNAFGFLNLDIDGYDYFVLDRLLSQFRPRLICAEINEKIPPPLKFTVKWSPDYVWNNDHFYGQSICQLDLLCQKYDYALVELHYNNAFLVPREISPSPSLVPEVAYRQGYLERSDRQQKFPWNADIEALLHLSPEEAIEYVNQFFVRYQGKFECTV